tara:strand:- start:11317 stop:13482 length:2166 start_codon:yes stop_codon:yes gene_type:complete
MATNNETWGQPRRVLKSDKPFDLGACENEALSWLLVKAAMSNGWPRTRSAILLSMVNREFRDLVRTEMKDVVESLQDFYSEWRGKIRYLETYRRSFPRLETNPEVRERVKQSHDEVKRSRGAFVAALQEFVGLQTGQKCVDYIEAEHTKDATFSWTFTRTLLSSMTLRVCMACAGKCVKCSNYPHKAESSWLTVCGQQLFAKRKCWDWVSVPFSKVGDPLGWHEGLFKPKEIDAAHETGCLARAMLRQAEIYESNGHSGLFVSAEPRLVNSDSFNQPLCLETHAYIPRDCTLQGRLGLNQLQMALAYKDQHATLQLMQAEQKAIQDVRVAKFRKDVDMWITARLGQNLNTFTNKYEKFGHTLDRLLRLHDPADPKNVLKPNDGKNRYISALQIPAVKDACVRLAEIHKHAVTSYKTHIGREPNVHALEWAANLFSGVMNGPHGPWRASIDGGTGVGPSNADGTKTCWILWNMLEDPIIDSAQAVGAGCHETNLYFIAALHIFNDLGTSQCEIDVKNDHLWYLKCKGGLTLSGPLPRRSHDEAKQVHKMILSAFQHYQHLNGCGEIHCHRESPSAATLKKAYNGSSETAVETYILYNKEVAALLNMFSELRAIALFFLGISPEKFVGMLEEKGRRYHMDSETFLKQVVSGAVWEDEPNEECPVKEPAFPPKKSRKRAITYKHFYEGKRPQKTIAHDMPSNNVASDDEEELQEAIEASFAQGL